LLNVSEKEQKTTAPRTMQTVILLPARRWKSDASDGNFRTPDATNGRAATASERRHVSHCEMPQFVNSHFCAKDSAQNCVSCDTSYKQYDF
jgi:hypothetical protein